MAENKILETNLLMAKKVKNITTVANAVAAPTKAEFDALVAQFNALANALKDTKTRL